AALRRRRAGRANPLAFRFGCGRRVGDAGIVGQRHGHRNSRAVGAGAGAAVLVAQIPSLFVSVAAGVLVTRVSSDSDMGTEIAGQLFVEPRALVMGSVILVGMAVVSGDL